MLKTVEIGKEYNKDKVALNDVSLTFPDTGLVIIKGESGSGKSTLLNMLTAHDYPTSGILEFNGKEINPKNSEKYRKSYCSNIYQDYMLIEDMTVGENIELAMQAYGEAYTTDSIKQLLQRVGIPEEYMTKQASKLSGGEKQRVSIARAVAKEHAMIFADEPTGNLDSVNGEMVMDLLKEISKDRLVVVVSHNEEYNIKYADYTVELVDGVVENSDLPTEDNKEEQAPISFESKSKLKAKTLGKLAFWGFKKNKVKMAVSIVAFVMLCILSVVFTVCTVADVNLAYTYSLDKCKNKHFVTGFIGGGSLNFDQIESFEKKLGFESSEIYDTGFAFEVGEEDTAQKIEFAKKYQLISEDEEDPYYTPSISKEMIYNPKVGIATEVLYGDFPKEYNDVMIPYCYAQYMAAVLIDYKTDDIKNLIGREIEYSVSNSGYEEANHFIFKICGIFEEGEYYTDLEKPQTIEVLKYYQETNYLADCVIVSPEIKEIWLNDASHSGITRAPNSYDIVKKEDYDPNDRYEYTWGDFYGYNKYSDYAKKYAPLSDGEVYISSDFAKWINAKVGDELKDLLIKDNDYVHGDFCGNLDGLIVKGIIEYDRKYFIIFPSQYYVDTFVKIKDVSGLRGFYFNMKDVNNVYGRLNKITSLGYKEKIWWGAEIGDNIDVVYTENIIVATKLYDMLIGYRYFVFLPLMLLSLAGLAAMGFVSASYLISSKGNSYNIMRSLGFGKKDIAAVLSMQIVILILAGCIIGISMGALGCHLFGNAYKVSTLGKAVAKVSTEIILPLGYVAPIVVTAVSLLLGFAIVFAKTKSLFAKSIMENKTN